MEDGYLGILSIGKCVKSQQNNFYVTLPFFLNLPAHSSIVL